MMTTFRMSRAKPSTLLAIVHQVLDSEVDAPPVGSVEERALGAFVEALFHGLETWPELDAVRAQCTVPAEPFKREPPTEAPYYVPPPVFSTGIGPEHDFWQRAYLTALAAAMDPHAPYSADHIARLAVIAEGSADFALHAAMKLNVKGEIGLRRVAVERQVQAQKEAGL